MIQPDTPYLSKQVADLFGFSSEIRKNGLDGLISLLNKRNKNLSEAFDTQIK